MTRAAPQGGEAIESQQAAWSRHPLTWLLLLAAALRLPLAFWPNVYAPDEIYQFIEPAWRLLGHDAIISWEWRYGIRSWTMPALLAAPVALGDWLAPGGYGLFVVPRLLAALASLSIVASAWGFGARVSRAHALVAGFVATIWFEFVLFAPHTLGEPLATAMILPAAWLLTLPAPSRRQLAGAGALLALALVCRFQYAPAVAVLVIAACWRRWPRLVPVVAGGMPVLIACGIIDALNGAMPFAWLIANVQQNMLHGRAVAYGADPLLAYFGNLRILWSFAVVPVVFAIALGWQRAPLLLSVALTNLVFHSLIGHKEYRFIFLTVTLFIIIAALGSVEAMMRLRRRRGWRLRALPLVMGIWAAISATLACTGAMPEHWRRGIGAAQLASELRGDPAMCGLALYEVPFYLLPGRERLAGQVPIYSFDSRDPMLAAGTAKAAQAAEGAFNRILARRHLAADLPARFVQGSCAMVIDTEVCIYARSGRCDASQGAPYRLEDTLSRLDQ
jgi:hypothetical protein